MPHIFEQVTGSDGALSFQFNGQFALKNYTVEIVNGNRLKVVSNTNEMFSLLEAEVSEVEINGQIYSDASAAQLALQNLVYSHAKPVVLTEEMYLKLAAAVQAADRGQIFPDTQMPAGGWSLGWYTAGISSPYPGTNYPNQNNLKADEDYATKFYFNGTVWVAQRDKMPKAQNFIPSFTDSTFPLVSTTQNPVQRIHEDSIWLLIPGQTSSSTDIPGVSAVWKIVGSSGKAVADFYNEKANTEAVSKTLITTGTIPFTTVFIDSNNNEWIMGFGSNTLYIYKNGELFHQRALNQNDVMGFAAYKVDNIFHILLSSTQASGARYLTFNVATLTITEQTKLNNAQYIRFNNIVDFGGVLYVAVNQVSGSVFIDLYKLDGSTWTFVKKLADDTLKWGEKWIGDSSVSGATFYAMAGTYIRPTAPLLSVENEALILSFNADSESVSDRYFVYSMRSTNGVNFTQYDILDWNRGYEIGSYVTEKGERYYLGSKFVDAYTTFKLAVMHPKKKSFYIIDAVTALKKFSYKNGKLLIAFAEGNTLKYISLDHKKAEDVINGFGNRFLNEVFPNSTLPTSLNIGDYVLAQSSGSYTNFIEHRYHGQTVYIDYPVELNKGDKAYLVWNGLTWNKRVFEENSSGVKNYTPFENVYRHNEFFSKAFRIPVATITEKGTILIGTDVRYTRGEDYDVIDVGVARSLNNGKSWTDYKIAMARPDKSDGKRIHDVGLTVDRNKGSVNYGRIWMISKFWDVNITPLNTTYWKDNSANLKFYQCYSDDDGVTWSDITELSNVYSVPNAYHWSGGANAGITLNDGTLIQPMYWGFKTSDDRAGFIYKLPDSNTWQVGDLTPNTVVANENQIIQNVDGKLIMVARSNNATKSVFELTTIGGGWTRRTDLEANLSEIQYGCQSSFIRYRNTYLISKPKGLVDGYKRTEITVYYSYDMITWTELITLTKVPGLGYSSLVCDDSYFGVAYEQNITPNCRIDYADLNYLRPYLK